MFVVIDDVQGYWKESRGWSGDLNDAKVFTTINDIPETLLIMWKRQYNSNVYVIEYAHAERYDYNTKLHNAKSVHDIS